MDEISDAALINLESGDLRADLAPAIGGSLAGLRLRRGGEWTELMRPLSQTARQRRDPIGAAMFPMVPYANRVAGNAFTFRGQTYRLAANNPPERFNVHGTGWRRPWRVELMSADRAVLQLNVDGTEEPYVYMAEQSFELTAEGLTVSIRLRNCGNTPMPFGFGQHPWFPRDPDTRLRFSASQFWLEGPDGTTTDPITLPAELDFGREVPLPSSWRNNCYGGWDGIAEVSWPSRRLGLRIEADPVFRHLMFYADPTKPFFCLEPQTHASGALNRIGNGSEVGLIVLEPGETVGGAIRFVPFEP